MMSMSSTLETGEQAHALWDVPDSRFNKSPRCQRCHRHRRLRWGGNVTFEGCIRIVWPLNPYHLRVFVSAEWGCHQCRCQRMRLDTCKDIWLFVTQQTRLWMVCLRKLFCIKRLGGCLGKTGALGRKNFRWQRWRWQRWQWGYLYFYRRDTICRATY